MLEKRKALGRGLESLLPGSRGLNAAAVVTGVPQVAPAVVTSAVSGVTTHHDSGREPVYDIAVDLIERNPYQTRTAMDEAALSELVASIQSSGVIQPIVLRAISGGRYQLITGERRWKAAIRAGLSTIPALVREVSNQQAMEMTIIENLQRQDLNPMDQAHAFDRLAREFALTQEQVAKRTGAERASVANYLRLLKLPPEVQIWVQQGTITFSHAKLLMSLDSAEMIIPLAKRAVEEGLSVRALESIVFDIKNPADKTERTPRFVDPNVREAERQMERALGVRVVIRDKNGKGKIVIDYKSLEDFDRVVEILGRQ
jgi:ParB family transcriptional regulator, chromosome partitioning protein